MFENELVNGKKVFIVVELMDGLYKSIFVVIECGGLFDVMICNLQKGFVDVLIIVVVESEGVKVNKKLIDNYFLFDFQILICSCDDYVYCLVYIDCMGVCCELNFYGFQINCIFDVILVKCGELFCIKDLF